MSDAKPHVFFISFHEFVIVMLIVLSVPVSGSSATPCDVKPFRVAPHT
jgi:hypothetical protein